MRWKTKSLPSEEKIKQLTTQLGVSRAIAILLAQRGIEDFDSAKQFFRPDLSQLHDPFLMQDMGNAVDRILQAIATNERIMVYGDYDVDGTTSVALMTTYLKSITPEVISYIPDRYGEGYGISYQGIDFAADNDITLIVALDCGIKAIDKVAYAKNKGIDFIICDHHRPGEQIPEAVAVLDPKRKDCNYPYKELCGCGVGFKLIQALQAKRKQPFEALLPYLDLVATAIGADIVPITGENRILAHYGMQVINTEPRAGFKALIATHKKTELSITDVVFTIAPRINAAGRMKHGLHAVDLLMEQEEERAKEIAQEIETYNYNRRQADTSITKEALALIEADNEEAASTTVVYSPHWHKGVIGIVASRLTETYYRPTLVFTKSGDKLAASARSVIGFDVYDALEDCAEHIEQFGGHKYAAGLTLKEENYLKFKEKFEEVVRKKITKEQLTPEIPIDLELNFDDITPKFYRILKQFAPFGPQNLAPVFTTKNVTDTGFAKTVGADHKHLKCYLKQASQKQQFSGIGFGLGEKLPMLQADNAQIAYVIEENEWNGKCDLQLRIKDIKPE